MTKDQLASLESWGWRSWEVVCPGTPDGRRCTCRAYIICKGRGLAELLDAADR